MQFDELRLLVAGAAGLVAGGQGTRSLEVVGTAYRPSLTGCFGSAVAGRDRQQPARSGPPEVPTKRGAIHIASNEKRSIVGTTKELGAGIGLVIFNR
jgi:hypothetical protein